MPFIRGRYHINPAMGEALEAAREAEAALLALEHTSQQGGDDDGYDFGDAAAAAPDSKGPIHRVEIEAAEVVPSHSGHAQSGFVARVHRRPTADAPGAYAPAYPPGASTLASRGYAPSQPETHVFSDHRDLVGFLRDQFAKDHRR